VGHTVIEYSAPISHILTISRTGNFGHLHNPDEESKNEATISNVLLKNRQYERKGQLFKKSMNDHKFKQRQFVLLGEQLYYYKKNT